MSNKNEAQLHVEPIISKNKISHVSVANFNNFEERG